MGKKLILFIILLVTLPPAAYAYYNYALSLPNSSDETAVGFTIETGQGVEEIAKNLEQEGLVRSAGLFQLYTSLSKLSSGLQAGEYQIPQNLNLKEVVEVLQHGTFEEKLTFIEGWRREEYADEISNVKTHPSFAKATEGAPRSSKSEVGQNSNLDAAEFLRESEGLEGYLFPDTYFISAETTAEELVKMMRENFDKKVGQP